MLLGGEFTMATGAARDNLVRLLPNVAVDTDFLAFGASVRGGHEQVGHCRRQHQVVMKPQPRPVFKVVQPQVTLASLAILLHRETPRPTAESGRRWRVVERAQRPALAKSHSNRSRRQSG